MLVWDYIILESLWCMYHLESLEHSLVMGI